MKSNLDLQSQMPYLINTNKRIQRGLKLHDFYPSIDGVCACGCGLPLTGRKKRWATPECSERLYSNFAILKGNNSAIRKEVFNRDLGYCCACGVFDNNWQADHILPVYQGGGACGLDNFQTLCISCHKEKHQHGLTTTHEQFLRTLPLMLLSCA